MKAVLLQIRSEQTRGRLFALGLAAEPLLAELAVLVEECGKPQLGCIGGQAVDIDLHGERSEKIGALERGFFSPSRSLIIVVSRHTRSKENDHAQAQTQRNGESQRRPHSNREIASRRSGPRSKMSSSRSKPNAAMGA